VSSLGRNCSAPPPSARLRSPRSPETRSKAGNLLHYGDPCRKEFACSLRAAVGAERWAPRREELIGSLMRQRRWCGAGPMRGQRSVLGVPVGHIAVRGLDKP
jgi:hypothetical protein